MGYGTLHKHVSCDLLTGHQRVQPPLVAKHPAQQARPRKHAHERRAHADLGVRIHQFHLHLQPERVRNIVPVHTRNQFAGRSGNTCVQRLDYPCVRHADHPEALVASAQGVQDLRRRVGGTVVHCHNLQVTIPLAQNAVYGAPYGGLGIMDWNENGYSGAHVTIMRLNPSRWKSRRVLVCVQLCGNK